MKPTLIICIPGPWKDEDVFRYQVLTLEPDARYMFTNGILIELDERDHVPLELRPADPKIPDAFRIAGQGKIPQSVLAKTGEHASVAFLHFPLDIRAQRDRVAKFTELMQRLGGMAVKVETAGIAHTWERWFALLKGTLFELYSSAVVLIRGRDHYYSCGMHNFGLPECAVTTSLPAGEAASLMNRFNFYLIDEQPIMKSGHTFSVSVDAPHYRLTLAPDSNHEAGEPFFNGHGVWFLDAV